MDESLIIENYCAMLQHLEQQGFSCPSLYPQPPKPEAITRLASYLRLLQSWTARVDLVAPASDLQQVQRHLVDCMAAQLVLSSKQLNLPQGKTADIGSGAGLPGLVWAIVDPERQHVLVEPRKKRVVFLREVVSRLKLENVEVRETRQEDLITGSENELSIIACRALGALGQYLVNSKELLIPGGVALVLAGPGEIESDVSSRGLSYYPLLTTPVFQLVLLVDS